MRCVNIHQQERITYDVGKHATAYSMPCCGLRTVYCLMMQSCKNQISRCRMQSGKVAHDGINGGPLPQGVQGSTVPESKHACQELCVTRNVHITHDLADTSADPLHAQLRSSESRRANVFRQEINSRIRKMLCCFNTSLDRSALYMRLARHARDLVLQS